MKSILFVAIASLSSFVAIAQQDTIPNPGFERWGTNPAYDEATLWTTLNPLAQILGAELAFKTTVAGEFHSGLAAIKLVTTPLLGIGMAPSILTNGVVNSAAQTIEGGDPINSRPSNFGGWFRYDPVGTDTAFFQITLTRWNTVTGQSEEVGFASSEIVGTNGLFVNLELDIEYGGSELPDTVLILMGASGDEAEDGSTLFVDDLYYGYPQGIESSETFGPSIFPNPATDVLNFTSLQSLQFNRAVIYSADGKRVQDLTIDATGSSVNVSGLRSGMYIIELNDAQGNTVRQLFRKD